jgi:hypothetical protein
MEVWTKVTTARQYGYDVREARGGWQIGKRTAAGWDWSCFKHRSRAAALRCAFNLYTSKAAEIVATHATTETIN